MHSSVPSEAGDDIMTRQDECSVLDSSLLMELTIQMYVCPSQFQEERGNAENTSMPISRDFYSTLLL